MRRKRPALLLRMAFPDLHGSARIALREPRLQCEFLPRDSISRMATDAEKLFVRADEPPGSVSQTDWDVVLVSHSRSKPIQLPKPADPAFIPPAILLKECKFARWQNWRLRPKLLAWKWYWSRL